MKRIIYLLFCFLIAGALNAQQFTPHQYRHTFLQNGAASYQNGLLGFANPAASAMLQRFNWRYYWTTDETENLGTQNWGLLTGAKGLGFGAIRTTLGDHKVTDYNISLASGNRSAAFGIGYRWTTGDGRFFGRENLISTGWVLRPSRYLSAGLVGNFSTRSSAKEGVLELGIRPLGTPVLSVFGDFSLQKDQQLADAAWSAGAALQVVKGIHLTGRYFDNERFNVGFSISWGGERFSGQSHFDSEQDRQFNSYSVGYGDYAPSVFEDVFSKKKHYVAMGLKGLISYQKYKWFDNSQRFMDILQTIENARRDPAVDVVALNLSAMRIYPEHAWEIREALRAVKADGKKVVIFVDNAGMTGYHLASVADVLMMDPQGSLQLPGYVLSRTYLKGTLEKLGLGFDEWRFFKYKSAAEMLSRDEMSAADREQRQALVDDSYMLFQKEVAAARNISSEKLTGIIDEKVYVLPNDALAEGLVDTLCRWSELDGVIRKLTGAGKIPLPGKFLAERANVVEQWGEPARIAVVYALGECAMDSGIRARWLEKVFLKLAKARQVKAVVFRVDSPGGDGMASDVVAEALKKCAANKPVVISQGQVAASGGYWISMYGDSIVAGPNTITGSIGVIGGWVYDKGIGDKLGMTSDLVKQGNHADLGAGVRLPLLNLQVPARNLTGEERERVKDVFLTMYDGFVGKVAAGRKMPVDSIRAIAEGQVFSGTDGLANGLVDKIGGMQTAIEMARKMAGLDDNYRVLEIPKYRGTFNSNFLSPFAIKKSVAEDPVIRFIKTMSDRPGYPRPMLLPGDYPIQPE